MRRARFLAFGVAAVVLAAMSLTPAHADHQNDGPRDPVTVAKAMFADPSLVVSAALATDGAVPPATPTATDPAAVMSYAAAPGSFAGFPTNGADFAQISSGDTDFANDPNDSESTGQSNDGLNTNAGTDLSGLTVTFNLPAVANPCLQLDAKQLSEEFPEFVGSAFNDFSAAALSTTLPMVDPATNDASLAGNFLFGAFGAPLEINTPQLVDAANAAPTTYDGATPILLVQTALTPGVSPQTATFWTGDVGDSIFDTNLFLDNLRIIDLTPCPTTTIGPSLIGKIKVKTKGNFQVVQGVLLPPSPGSKVIVIFFANGSPFHKVGKKKAKVKASGKFAAKFPNQPDATKCKVKVQFKGDQIHFPSKTKQTVKC